MKKGSALLVVLGMLAFMLISAVSFSAYMRYSRLPSSFLRRSSASRLLVKAALAEAIDEIDGAIGNNPHPGIGTLPPRQYVGILNRAQGDQQADDRNRTRNTWLYRVFLGTNVEQSVLAPLTDIAQVRNELKNRLVDPDETVSTLTLEGLAYLPPALANEVRYYSRRSHAAIWKPLGFDSGRYAYCAVDVSDLFDVNVLSAKVPRNSSPSGRISLAYLFEEGEEHTGYGATDPKAWDDFLVNNARVRQISAAEAEILGQDVPAASANYVPFVSVADYNLQLHELVLQGKLPAGYDSPFCRYVGSSGSSFYGPAGVMDATGDAADKVKHVSFITDSLFPQPAATLASKSTDLCDLSNFDEQPFTQDDLTLDNFPVDRLVDNPTKESARRIANKTSFFGLAALYDYLDANNVPVSLAMPTTERAPMICGIGNENMGSAKLTVSKEETKLSGPEPGAKGVVQQRTIYKIDDTEFSKFIDDGTFKAVLAYPFRRGVDLLDAMPPFKFTLEGYLTVFFAREGAIGFRSGGGLLSPTRSLFTDAGKMDNGVLRIPLKFEGFKNVSFDTVQTDDNAVRESDAILSMSSEAKAAIMDYLKNNPLLTVEEEWDVDETGSMIGSPRVTKADSSLSVIKSGGAAELLGSFLDNREEKLVVGSVLCLRVKNGNDKTVDLVPASLEDDDALNNANNSSAAIIADLVGRSPLMLTTANAGKPLVVSCTALKAADSSTPINLDFTMNVQCIDPRWNWAPEHWYSTKDDKVTKDSWLKAVRGATAGQTGGFLAADSGRDGDIFLTTSDAGYLQSVYELAFLPRFTSLQNYGNNQVCGNMELLNGSFNNFETNPEQVKNRHLMWRSYHPFATDTGADRDPFEDLKIVNDGGGFRINPYSEDLNVLMGAFANTPVDWWAASTTTKEILSTANGKMEFLTQAEKLDARQFNQDFAFNEFSSAAKLKWKGLENIATRFQTLIRQRLRKKGTAATGDTWMDVFDGVEYSGRPTGSATDPASMSVSEQLDVNESLDWDNKERFCDVDLSGSDDLYGVDRKFLYGFWRECFAAKQQLFLVFVRAEPMMMGSGASGRTPPQLGGRAVALVWRDPTKSRDDDTPHRTRVLFYRQFD